MLTLAQSGTQNGFTASVTRQFWYDGDLRLCRHRAPEFGDEVFLYDSEGLLTQSGRGAAAASGRGAAAASGCVSSIPVGIAVTRGYDALHRETDVTFPAGTPGIARGYDGNGNVTSATRTGGAAWSYAYDGLDALTQEKLVIDARTYQLDYAYNANGDLASRTNGHSGVAFSFDPDAFGRPRAARVGTTNYIAGVSYHPNGLIAAASYLNGQLLSQTLNARQRPDQLKTAKVGGATAVWLTYAYEARGKVSSATDTVSAAENRSYTYDPNGRLLTATGWWGSGSYVYDALGNIRTRGEGSAGTSTIAYDAATNRVASATLGSSLRTYSYDDRGNVTSNGPTGFTYDFANQPTALTGTGAASFAYDANLKRVKEVRAGKTVYTVYSRVTGGLVYRDEVTDARKTDYVTAGGAALRLTNGVPTYTHFDAQGTALAATNSAGAILWREHYTPFGKGSKWAGQVSNDNDTGFTGHLEDDASGLIYMQARYYDPLVPRFLSTDPVGYQDQLNLYAYVANDPVNKVDPTGLEIDTKGDCTKTCEVVDKQFHTGSRIPTVTHIGTFTPGTGPELDPPKEGNADTSTAAKGAEHFMRGGGTPGQEDIKQIRGINTQIAKALGRSALGTEGSAGTLKSLIGKRGGSSPLRITTGETPDITAGQLTLEGSVSVTTGGGQFSASGSLTGRSEPFDMNSNPNRGTIGNAAVVLGGVAMEALTFGGAQPFVQDYYGTIYYKFTGPVQ